MASVKEMRATNAAQGAERRTQILMITGCENSSTSFAKARNALTICGTQAVTIIDGEKPKLVKIGCVEHA